MARELRTGWAWPAVLAVLILAGCTSAHTASPAHTALTPHAPSGVPTAVYAAARQQLQPRGNRVDQPVEWVRTTFGVWERALHAGSEPGKANVPVYVVELHGSFLFTGSHTTVTATTPRHMAVAGVVFPIGPYVSGVTGGWGADQPTDLSAMGVVHTFRL